MGLLTLSPMFGAVMRHPDTVLQLLELDVDLADMRLQTQWCPVSTRNPAQMLVPKHQARACSLSPLVAMAWIIEALA